MDSGAYETVIRAQTATDALHTIKDETSSSESSDESSMRSLPGLQERNMQDSDDDESTDGDMQFEFDLSEFSDDTMASSPTGLYSNSPSTIDKPSSKAADTNVQPPAQRSGMFAHMDNMSSSLSSSCLSSFSMPGLAQRFQDDSSSDGSMSDA